MNRFLKPAFANKNRRPRTRRPALRIERLEARQMMTADALSHLEPIGYFDEFSGSAEEYADVVDWQSSAPGAVESFDFDGLPILHSNPHASKTLHLNFRGNVVTIDWLSNNKGNLKGLETYTFDFDNDPSYFGAVDQSMIRQIWQVVAEDFAPFDVDVTTEYSGEYGNGHAVNVAIGGTNNDINLATGTARLNGFAMGLNFPVVVPTTNIHYQMALQLIEEDFGVSYKPDEDMIKHYMDTKILETGLAIGNTVSHEAGHFFGLEHDRAPDIEYDPGTDVWTPIMGTNLSHDRSTWSHHLVNWDWVDGKQVPIYEDNLAQLTKVLGARRDDHGNVDALARPMTDVNAGIRFEAAGIITTMDDVDVFSFSVLRAGKYEIDINVPAYANLDAAIDWYGPMAPMIDGPELEVHESVWLEAGKTYFLRVRSHGVYGDLGHYTAAVTWDLPEIGPLPELLDIPFLPELDPIDPNPEEWTNPPYVDDPAEFEPWSADDVPPLVDPIDGAFDDYGPVDPIFDEPIVDDYETFAPVDNYWNWDLALATISASNIRANSLRRF